MSDTIRDGTGKGFLAKVNFENRVMVASKAASIQHVVSSNDEDAYQVIGTANLAATTVVVLHLTNNDSEKNAVVTYLRHQIINASGGTAFPNSSNYFRIALGRTYSSGGSAATPVNVYSGSGTTAKVTCYQAAPTLTGTANEIDRWYTKDDGDMNTFNKEGSLIIPPNKTIEIAYVGNHTSGICYGRISFIMEE
jgi:hypothetical protein